MTKATIYRIDCTGSGRIYIGMTKNFRARHHYHLYRLHARNHETKSLQADFDLFGEEGFVFRVLRDVSPTAARAEEMREIEELTFAGHDLYNTQFRTKYSRSVKLTGTAHVQ